MGPELTPGVNRVIEFTVEGHRFVFRRPTRGDIAEAHRRTALKLTVLGLEEASDRLNRLDGYNRQWEARLEVGLMPRDNRGSLGETAPSHWIEVDRDADGKELARRISFADVQPEEFEAVVAYLDAELKKKAQPKTQSTSSTSVDNPNNA